MRAPRILGTIAMAAVIAAGGPAAAVDRPLLVDLSRPEVRINSAFRGADITLFGTMDGPGDIVVVVVGPPLSQPVLRKERVLGLWITGGRQVFINVPGYYAVAASAPLTRVLARGEVATETILLDQRLREVQPQGGLHRTSEEMEAYRNGLRGAKTRLGLYPEALAKVTIQGERLFRVDLHFPASLPTGTYEVRTYQVHEGRITSTVTRPLPVHKTGFSARVYNFAQTEGPAYGLLAIIMALFIGWAGAALVRRT
jgi:uncharacterized protein (TIGR02186 family)